MTGACWATLAGNTGRSFPSTHSSRMSLPCGSPTHFQERFPSTHGHEPWCSASMIFWLSSELTFLTAASRTCPVAYASDDVESIGSEPNFLWYAATKSEFPAEGSPSYQSPALKMPFTL